jgi:hypothetical protein
LPVEPELAQTEAVPRTRGRSIMEWGSAFLPGA